MKVGIDLIEISRFEKIEKDKNKIQKIFTENEIKYFEKFKFKTCHIAGTFCAKESFVKALKIGFNKDLTPLDVEILHEEKGNPYINTSRERIKKLLNNKKVDVSISHSDTMSTAVCIIY